MSANPYQAERDATRALFKNITKPEVIALIREWWKVEGEPPRRIDWDPALALREGKGDLAARFYDEKAWPLAGTVVGLFGSFTAAVIEAGFYPRMRTREWQAMNPESRSGYLREAVHVLEALERRR